MTKDGCVNALNSSRMSSGVVAPVNREVGVRLFESMLGFDSMEVSHNDYSVKPQRFLKALEQLHMELLQETTIFPLLYGFMPNLGLYYRPDGSFAEPVRPAAPGQDRRGAPHPGRGPSGLPGRLHPHERLHARDGRRRHRLRHRGLHRRRRVPGRRSRRPSTSPASPACRSRSACRPRWSWASTASSNTRARALPACGPISSSKLCEKAGAAIFGPVVNTNTKKSTPWNLARAVTFVKACTADRQDPDPRQRGHGRRRRADVRDTRRRRRHALQRRHGRDRQAATGYRWVQAIQPACTWRICWPRRSVASGLLEIW